MLNYWRIILGNKTFNLYHNFFAFFLALTYYFLFHFMWLCSPWPKIFRQSLRFSNRVWNK